MYAMQKHHAFQHLLIKKNVRKTVITHFKWCNYDRLFILLDLNNKQICTAKLF